MHDPVDPAERGKPVPPSSPPLPEAWTRPEAATARPPPGEGSMLKGYVLGWCVPIAASMASGLVLGLFSALMPGSKLAALFALLGVLAPFVAFGFLVAWAYRDGRQTGRGVWAAALTLVGFVVLLLAACFGMLALGMFGNMH